MEKAADIWIDKEADKNCMLYYPFDNEEEVAEARQDARQELQNVYKRRMENKKKEETITEEMEPGEKHPTDSLATLEQPKCQEKNGKY